MINKKNIIFASTQVKKIAKCERKQQNYLYFSRQNFFESLTDTLNFRTVCYYLTNLINDLSSLKLQSR